MVTFHIDLSVPLDVGHARLGVGTDAAARFGRQRVGPLADKPGADQAGEDDNHCDRQSGEHDPKRTERVMDHMQVNARDHDRIVPSLNGETVSDVKRRSAAGEWLVSKSDAGGDRAAR